MTEAEAVKTAEVNEVVPPAVFTAENAAKYLGIAPSTLFQYVREGKIKKGLRYSSRKTVWRKTWLDEFIDAVELEQKEEV